MADVVIVLLIDPVLAGNIGAGQKGQELLAENLGRRRWVGHIEPGGLVEIGWLFGWSVVLQALGQIIGREIGKELAALAHHHAPRVGHLADDRGVQVPFLEYRHGLGLAAPLDHHQHALLGLSDSMISYGVMAGLRDTGTRSRSSSIPAPALGGHLNRR